jgi:hypothetical protein
MTVLSPELLSWGSIFDRYGPWDYWEVCRNHWSFGRSVSVYGRRPDGRSITVGVDQPMAGSWDPWAQLGLVEELARKLDEALPWVRGEPIDRLFVDELEAA